MAAKLEVLTRQQVRQLSVVQAGLEVIDWILYDKLIFATGGTAVTGTFFQQAVGQAGVTKEVTDMEIPGQLPSGHKFVCQKIVVSALPAVAGLTSADYVADAFALTHAGYAEMNIGTRPYLTCPILDLIGGNLQGFAGGATSFGAYAQSRTVINGELEYSPVIPSNYAFNVTVTYPAAPTLTANTGLRCQLVGKMIRPRQG